MYFQSGKQEGHNPMLVI